MRIPSLLILVLFNAAKSCVSFVLPSDTAVHVGQTLQQQHPRPYQAAPQKSPGQCRLPPLFAAATSSSTVDPQVIATGYSTDDNLSEAIREATELALEALPDATPSSKIDLAVIFVSSLYDGTSSPSVIVPSFLDAASSYGQGIQHVIGSTASGVVGSVVNTEKNGPSCQPVEIEGSLGVSVALFVLPDVQLQTFHCLGEDVPDDFNRLPASMWKEAVGLKGLAGDAEEAEKEDGSDNKDGAPLFMVLPSPAFQNVLEDLLRGLGTYFPNSKIFGALASTVSSLSRARLFRYDAKDPQGMQTFSDGCVGIAMTGDVDVRTMVAQGAKPVGGIYKVVKATGSTINAIVLDDAATELERASRESEGDDALGGDDEEDSNEPLSAEDKKAQMAAAYAKASIPKPCLAEANFLMRVLSDDDQSFMRKALLVGLERGGSVGRTPSELARLRAGQGHRFEVKQVASAGMKDGSITLPLGKTVEPGSRMRFYVRDSSYAKKEVEALWMGYKKRVLSESFEKKSEEEKPSFRPTGCFVMPTLDRGNKFFKGKSGFESSTVTTYIPEIGSVSGFFSNGVVMKLDENDPAEVGASIHGSSSGYVLFGSSK